jgi:mono/diheme cytochrome c family protein
MNAAELAEGKALYMEHCASCHGRDLEGQDNWRERRADGKLPAPPHDETGHTWHHPDSQLFAITKHGTAAFAPEGYKTDMRGFGGEMSDAEIRQVLAWIKAQWPAEVRAKQAEITRRADGEPDG